MDKDEKLRVPIKGYIAFLGLSYYFLVYFQMQSLG